MTFVTGDRSGKESINYWQEIINKCHHERKNKVLVAMALRGKFLPFEAIEIYQTIIEMLKHSELQVALVDLNHLSASDSQVACNMAVSQGINISYFDSELAALEWFSNNHSNQNNPIEKSA